MKDCYIDIFKNWYDYNIIAEFDLLKSYIQETEILISKGILNYTENVETQEKEYDEYINSIDYYLNVDSYTFNPDEIFTNHFPNLRRQSLLIMICSFMENELYKLCLLIQNEENLNISFEKISTRQGKLEKINLYFKKTINKNYDKEYIQLWRNFKYYYKVRNQIVHNYGKINGTNNDLQKFITNQTNLDLNNQNELILKKGFLEKVIENQINLSKKIQELIRNYYSKN